MKTPVFGTKQIEIDRNENSKVYNYIKVYGYNVNSPYAWEHICNLPKNLNFTDKQITCIVERINIGIADGFEQGKLDKTNEFRDCLGLKELEEL